MQYREDRYGNRLSVLGFGCMRFTKKGNSIDIEKAEKEILAAYDAGVNYFDSAYIYPGSEEAIGQIFEKNGIRERVNIATKLPQYMIGSRAALDKYFNEQLARLRTDYIDYYLMHHMTDVAMWESLKKADIVNWIAEKKASGAIRNIGFSYHGNTDNFLKILNDYDWDFCQIQYNYLDEVAQAGRAGLMAAAEKGMAVIIMEPLRGGKLVNMLPQGALDVMKKSGRGWSPAEWGLRWLYDQKEVTVVLSGMNSLEMVEENCRVASEAEAGHLTREDFSTLEEVKKRDPGKGKGGLHRLPLLHALSQRGGYPRDLPLLQCHVYGIQKPWTLPVRPDGGPYQRAGFCQPVREMRQVRKALSPEHTYPGKAGGGGQSTASPAL